MVVQANCAIPIWGTALPGARVDVTFGLDKATTVAGPEGGWRVTLPARDVPTKENTGVIQVTTQGETVSVQDVAIGEVWLCAGQSNMRYTLGRREVKNDPASPLIFPDELASAETPDIRLLNVSPGAGSTPADRRWARCTPKSASGFSAIGIFFAQFLRHTQGVPIGLIDLGKGGQSLRAFLPVNTVATDPAMARLRSDDPEKRAGVVYENDVRWLAPFGLRGVLWYQGESDITRADVYGEMLRAMIKIWREDFENPGLPFLIVQLPGYAGALGDAAGQAQQSKWRPLFLEAQQKMAAPGSGVELVPAVDLGEENEIHPRGKKAVAERLALVARSKVYGEKIICDGPVLRSARRDGDTMVLIFDKADGSLVAKNRTLEDFWAAGPDGKFAPAVATIELPDRIRVSSRGAVHQVRYGWTGFFRPSLYNQAGYPSGPFRTDITSPAQPKTSLLPSNSP